MTSTGGLEQTVAVKVLRPDLLHDSAARRRIRTEGRLLSRLNHPCIVMFYDLIVLNGRIALVTEYVPGADLNECRSMENPLGYRALLHALASTAEALSMALNAPDQDGEPMGLMHRDIKPTNIRIGQHGQARIVDFGIARSDQGDQTTRSVTDLVVGSLAYMAPERFDERGALPASDVFGLGCCLYEGLLGEPFYGGGLLREISQLALDEGHFGRFLEQRLRELPSAVPRSIRELLTESLHHDPQKRPESLAVAGECERLADQIAGDNLRMWARKRSWPEDIGESGELTGQSLSEEPLPEPGETMAHLYAGAQVVEQAPETGVVAPPPLPKGGGEEQQVSTPLALDSSGEMGLDDRSFQGAGPPRLGWLVVTSAVTAALMVLGAIIGVNVLASRTIPVDETSVPPGQAPTLAAPPLEETPPPKEGTEQDAQPITEPPPVEDEKAPRKPSKRAKVPETPKPVKPEGDDSTADAQVDDTEPNEVVVPAARTEQALIPVASDSDVVTELRRGESRFPLPASVNWGTYQIWADFGGGLQMDQVISLRPGDQPVVRCKKTKKACAYSIE